MPKQGDPQNLPPAKTCQVSMGGQAQVSMPRQPKLQNISPTETCKVLGAMFQCRASMLHAKPIHNTLDLFPLLHAWSNFGQIILLRQLM